MKKRLVLGLVMILALACVLVSCNSEVSAENGVGSAKTGSIVIGQEASKAVEYTVSYTDTVEDLYWYYTAAKKDNGYRTGVTEGLTAVSSEKGLQGKTLTNFSYGLWDLNFYGFKQTSDSSDIANAVYTGSVINFLVHQEVNNADVELVLGNASTEIVFGTEGIYFTFDHDVSASTFTLAVTDNKGTVTVPTSDAYTFSNNGQTVKFTGLTYAGTTSNISGEHTMVFTLSQVLSGENNITIEAANYTLEFTVTTGTKTTISGDLTQNNQTGDIYINSASLSAAAAVSVSKALSSKVVPVTESTISVDANGVGTANVATETTITNGDLKVTYPAGAKIAVDGTTTSIDTTTADKKSDAQTGFEYVSDTASNTNISIATTEAVSQYELTINLADDNNVLAPVEKYIGTGLVITNIYHNSNTPMSNAYVNDLTEYWQYNSTTGYLTLYVFHASPFDIVYQKVVAYIGTNSYYSLASAFAAAESGNTITLAMDVPMDSGYSINKPLVLKQDNVIFDLNGKEITDVSNFSLTMQGENITVKNGKISSGVNNGKTTKINSYILVLNRCDGVVLDGLTLTGGISVGGSQDDWGSETSQKSSTDITGTVGYAGTSTGVVIKNCDVTSGDYYAICSQMNSQATIKSGTYTANTENSCSTSKVIHGYFVGTDGPQGYITVEGGTFNGSIALSNAGWVVLQGGTYSVDPTDSGCVDTANGYGAVSNGDGTWTVNKFTYKVGSNLYKANQFSTAWAAAKNSENAFELLEDVTLNALQVNGTYVVDLNGHTLTLNGHPQAGSDGTTGAAIFIDGGATWVHGNLTLKEGTLNMVGTGYSKYGIYNYGTMTLKDLTINSPCENVVYSNGQSWGSSGTTTIENVTINSTHNSGTALSGMALKNSYNGVIRPTLSIENSTINAVYNAVMLYGVNATVDGCTISATNNDALWISNSSMASGVYGTVTVKGNTTINAGSDYKRLNANSGHSIVIIEGTYNFNPSNNNSKNYVNSDNYDVADNGNGTWTVCQKVAIPD